MKEKRTYGLHEFDDIDCVEIDPNLRACLVGKGYRVVHDDFLDFYTRKRYDLVIMNPPFSEGDMHLLHALSLCEHGGQIACVLNAKTIRNPFTNSRKALLKELHRCGAMIRFMSNGFKKADRRTDVEIALINVDIPASDVDTSIFDNLQKAQQKTIEVDDMNEVAPADNVERLIREYDLLCAAGIAFLRSYNGIAPRIMSGTEDYAAPIITLKVAGESCSGLCGSGTLNEFLRHARARYWHELFSLPELRERMTSDMQKEYSDTIREMQDYEVSRFNIQQVLDKIRGQLASGVEAAIVKCFDKLSAEHSYHSGIENENVHYYNGWKTNKAHYATM